MQQNTPPFLAYRSFYTPLNTIETFARIGYDTVCLFPAHTVNSRGTPYSQYRPVWLWFDRLDFTPVEEMIHDVSQAMPQAKFLCMIDLNAPSWLEHINHDSCNDTFNNLGKAIHNDEWRRPTEDYLRQFLDTMEERYGDRVSAYVLCCGATDEWYDYSNGTESAERRIAWRKWCLKRGMPDPVDIPPMSARSNPVMEDFLNEPLKEERTMSAFREASYALADKPLGPPEEFIHDPAQKAMVVNYWKFCNESIAESLLRFAAITRQRIRPETQIGCFYGYILEKGFRDLVSCGHLDYERVMDSPDIDFLISPGTYTEERAIGGGSGYLIPNGSMRLRGKRLLHECDQRTHTYNSYLTPDINLRLKTAWPDERSTVAGLKREASLALLKNANAWWFDMWGDYYQGEAVMETLRQARELWQTVPRESLADVCEIALIVDPESTYYLDDNHYGAVHVNTRTRNLLNRVGAPFEVYSFDDIPQIPQLQRYRFVIFTTMFDLTAEREEILRKHLLRDDRSVLWLLAPGIIRDGQYDRDNCEKLTGLPLELSGHIQQRQLEGWRSYALYDYRTLTANQLHRMAEEAGVHLYADAGNPIYAAGDYVAMHVKEGGVRTLRIPGDHTSAEECFTGKKVPIAQGELTYEFQSPDTALFHLLP